MNIGFKKENSSKMFVLSKFRKRNKRQDTQSISMRSQKPIVESKPKFEKSTNVSRMKSKSNTRTR